MTTNEVYKLFSGYDVLATRTGEVAHINRDAVVFRTNGIVALRITYVPHSWSFQPFESSQVYFGMDGKVIGYYYEKPD